MRAARFGVATAALLAACGFALAHADARAAEDLRQRAEDLAKAASERFDEILRPQRIAQAQTGKSNEARKEPASEEPWSLATEWLERSGREYQGLMQRLSQAGDSKSPGGPATKVPGEKATESKAPTTKSERGENAGDWLTYSSDRFQWLMRRLADRAAPPDAVAEAEKRRALQMQAGKKEIEEIAKSKLPFVSAEKTTPVETTKPGTPTTEEERRLAETRRAEAAKRAEEVRKTEEALKIEQARKVADAKKIDEAAKAEEARKATEQAKKTADAKKADDAAKAKLAEAKKPEDTKKAEDLKRLEDAAKAEQARKMAEAKKAEEAAKADQSKGTADARKAEDDERRRVEERRISKEKAEAETKRLGEVAARLAEEKRLAEQTSRAVDHMAASRLAKEFAQRTTEPIRKEDVGKQGELTKGDAQRAESAKAAEAAKQAEAARKLESAQKAEAKKVEDARKVDDARKAEDARKLEAAQKAQARKAEEAKKADEARKVADAKRIETAQKSDAKKAEETKRADERAEDRRKQSEKRVALATRPTQRQSTQRSSRTCEAAGQEASLPGWYVVQSGDTLWAIAQRHYDAGWRYKRIFASNRKTLSSAHWIVPCQRLYIPRVARKT